MQLGIPRPKVTNYVFIVVSLSLLVSLISFFPSVGFYAYIYIERERERKRERERETDGLP